MSVAHAEPVLDRPATEQVRRTTPAPARTTPRRPGPGVGPTARPRRLRFTAPAVAPSSPGARACTAEPAPAPRSSGQTWRLTERGLAVVLVLAAALVAASIAVVGLTAVRVTGESYQPSHTTAAAPVLVQP